MRDRIRTGDAVRNADGRLGLVVNHAVVWNDNRTGTVDMIRVETAARFGSRIEWCKAQEWEKIGEVRFPFFFCRVELEGLARRHDAAAAGVLVA